MKLNVYLKINKIPVATFAKMLGVARVTIYDYLSGEKKPSSENMKGIVKLTQGAVTPNDFYDIRIKSVVITNQEPEIRQ